RPVCRADAGELRRSGVELGPLLLDRLAVGCPGVAGVDQGRAAAPGRLLAAAFRARLPGLGRVQGLEGDRADRAQELDQVGAALSAAEQLAHPGEPAGLDLLADQLAEIAGDLRADLE